MPALRLPTVRRIAAATVCALLLPAAALAQATVGQSALLSAEAIAVNKLSNGGFEAATPAYWTPSGAGATWSMAAARSQYHSLSLAGAGASSWTMAEAVRNWTNQYPANTELKLGAYVRADGVNVNPTSDAQKFQLVFEFFDQAGGTNLLGQPIVIDLPQTAASTSGFIYVDNSALGAITLPAAAKSARITFRKGASATGTMYVDDVFIQGGSLHGGSVDQSDGWYMYVADMDAGFPNGQDISNGVTPLAAHTGSMGLRLHRNSGTNETVTISPRVPVTVGEPVLLSYWLRTSGNTSPSTIGTGDNNVGLTALFYNNGTGGAAGYGEIGGLDIRLNGEYNPMVIPLLPRQADNGWTQYSFVVIPKVGATHMELRLRYWHQFTGNADFDDVFIGDVKDVVAALPNLLANGGFEAATPAYWTPTGAGATWSSAAYRSEYRSLALAGAGASSWTMAEAVRNWTNQYPANTELKLGAYVRADGVNVNPTTDADKFQLVFEFFDQAGGTNLLGQPIVIDLPQTAASTSGFVYVDNTALGAITLPAAAKSARITFRKGATATGTMYVDDVFIQGGSLHGGSVDQSDGWYMYVADMDAGFPNGQDISNGVAPAAAYSGSLGLRMHRNSGTNETVTISPRVAVTPGQPVLVTSMVRTAGNTSPSTIATGDNNIGFTTLWYNNGTGGAAGYGEIGGADVRFNGEYNELVIPKQPQTADSPWTRRAVVFYPKDGASHMEVRLRYWHQFSGDAHWDDVAFVNLGGTALPTANEDPEQPGVFGSEASLLGDAYPNPFSGRVVVPFRVAAAGPVRLDVFDVLGRRAATLIDTDAMATGSYDAAFDGSDLAPGVYLVVLRSGSHVETRRMVRR